MTTRLVLREPAAHDREALVALHRSPLVFAHLGGVRPRRVVELEMAATSGRRPGRFAVTLQGTLIGTVTLDRRDPARPGHLGRDRGEVELSYLFEPSAWGHGYAAEACAAVLDWCASALPGEPVVLCTQRANTRSVDLAGRLGFTEVQRFEEFGAEQWFGVRWPTPPG